MQDGADVTVVGSGPNGLAAAVVCARAGLKVQVLEAQTTLGGGSRTLPDLEFPGVAHDICSAIHPLALASPFFTEFDLPARGVELAVPEISYANPLPARRACIAYRDLARTCSGLEHGDSWAHLLSPMAARADAVVGFLLGDKRSLPPDLRAAAALGVRMLEQGTGLWNRLRGEDAQSLFTGVAAHAISRLPSMVAAGAGMLLATLAHTSGWPVPVGGSQIIADALIADLRAHGGELEPGVTVRTPPSGVVLYDTAPTALLDIYGDALPKRYADALRGYRFGPGVAKVDFVLSQDVPWRDGELAGAATLHLGGSHKQMALAERDVAAGRHAQWPMVLAAQSYAADPGRIDTAGRRPLWAYAHVPAGSTIDQSEVVTRVLERFAPGFSDTVLAVRSTPASRLRDHDANYVGGDIGVGGNSVLRALLGPTPRVDPWTTPIPHAYLCSSATPPGGGVHGMSGYYAARTMLRREFGLDAPSLRP
ncbi:MAG: NAD(P)/FAD-dependent oxidoreductase [Mycobacterium sp.]|nr:NAD(P)/FAD-dependent oxidoreductase [Mycobacterium sp.]